MQSTEKRDWAFSDSWARPRIGNAHDCRGSILACRRESSASRHSAHGRRANWGVPRPFICLSTDRQTSEYVRQVDSSSHSNRLRDLHTWNSQRNSQSFRCGDDGDQRGAAPGKSCQIFALVIRNSLFPAAKDYANPFERQRAHCPMVVHAFAALLPVIGSRPRLTCY